MILPAFCTLSLPGRRWTITALAAVSGITLANLAVTYSVWLPYRTDYAAIIASFQKIDRGSKILVGISGEDEDPPFRDLTRYPMFYAPTLAVHYIDALVPNLFTAVGKQPVQARAPVRRLAIPYGGPVPLGVLPRSRQASRPPTSRLSSALGRGYGYLYVLGPRTANPLPDQLEELEASPRFVLYKIRQAR